MGNMALNSVSINVENISLSFGETEVLKGVDLRIKPGEFFSFLGPSGSGKSTLLRLIAGFGPVPSTGRVLIGDEDITHLPPWKRNVGMVFQSYALWPHMTVSKNVAFGLEERKIPANEIFRRVDAALDLVGLLDLAERRPSQLSGGQQQRVALARTIVVEPRVLLLDEPLSNLDANLRVQMRRDLLSLQRELGLTTIFVTHDQEEANTTSDRMAVLNDGIVQQIGAPMDLYDNPENRFVADFLGTANMIDGVVDESCATPVFSGLGGNLSVPLAKDAHGFGGAGTLMFRPQNVTITANGKDERAGRISFSGVISHREFLGSLIRYGVQVADKVVLVDDSHQAGHPVYDEGASVSLSLDAAQTQILTQ